MRAYAATLALIVLPGIALAQSPSPAAHHGTPQPGHPTPRPNPSSHANRPDAKRQGHAPYQARVILHGDDVQKILAASPSPSAAPTVGPPKTAYPEPEVFHDTHN